MSYRTNSTIRRADSRVIVKIQWSAEWQEYRARLSIDGCDQQGADYFTDNAADAHGTGESMADTAVAELTHQTRKLYA
jgi:hypothetical protein